eukprot:COSAG02_NODE_62_length_43372_cov_14.404710_25_plen_460_part_00
MQHRIQCFGNFFGDATRDPRGYTTGAGPTTDSDTATEMHASESATHMVSVLVGLLLMLLHNCRCCDALNVELPRHDGRPASRWRRTNCGSPAAMNATHKVDIITQWGRAVHPTTVKTLFDYPRPQMRRGEETDGRAPVWVSLNGLWEFEPCPEWGCGSPPFGRSLNETILVPFPVESCLSGLVNHSNGLNVPPTYTRMHYRTTITTNSDWPQAGSKRVLLHFGAVDWRCDVYVNRLFVGSHEGGYDGFSFDVSDALATGHPSSGSTTEHELLVTVYDPSNRGSQPFGKQRIEAMYSPGGDTYSPVSGIWQPVWMEVVPGAGYITALTLRPNMTHLDIIVSTSQPDGGSVNAAVLDGQTVVAQGNGLANFGFSIEVPTPRLWSPESPFLYNLTVSYKTRTLDTQQQRHRMDGQGPVKVYDDQVQSYFGEKSSHVFWLTGNLCIFFSLVLVRLCRFLAQQE